MQKVAIIVIDVLKDFVTGSLKCDRAVRIISNIKNLLDHARNKNIPIIFSNDHHIPTVDKEFKLWGPHAVAGTEGARVIDELKPNEGGYMINKRRYSGFFETDLDLLLRELDIETVVLTGLHTNICVRHTAADAFFRGYKLIIPEDGVEAFTEEDHKSGIDYLKRIYGAEITTTSELIQEL